MSQSESDSATGIESVDQPTSEDKSRVTELFENSSHGEEFSHDITNTVGMVNKAYPSPWTPLLYEGVQNSTEGWLYNTAEGDIPDRDLEITCRVDTESEMIVWEDNAGGMPAEKLHDKFLGLDTPGEEKQAGDMGGGYGRGSVALLSLGEQFYVETKHASGHVSANGCVTNSKVAHSDVDSDTLGRLDERGTYIELNNPKEDVLSDLTDTDEVMETLLTKFPGIVERDDVTINYVLDGESVETPEVSLEELREKAESWTFDDFPTVSIKDGGTAQVKNLHVVDARELERDAPWKGVLLLKSDKYSEKPWMSIDDYNPVGVRALSDEEMFAWADVSEFCPDCEDAGHAGFIRAEKSELGIKQHLQELGKEHFRPDAAEQRRKVEKKAKENMNTLFSDYDSLNGLFGENNTQSLDEIQSTGSGPSRITVSPPQGEVTASGEVKFDVTVDGKNIETDAERVEVYHLILRDSETGEKVRTLTPTSVDVGEYKTLVKTVEVPSDGRYSFSAWLRDSSGERIDKSHVNFATKHSAAAKESDSNLSDVTGMGLVTDVKLVRLPDDVNSSRRYTTRMKDEGLEISVNFYCTAMAETINWSKEKRNEERVAILTKYGIEAAFDEYLLQNPDVVGEKPDRLREIRDEMIDELVKQYNGSSTTIALC